MAKITINNIDVQLPPLSYGVVKANKEVVDQVTTTGLNYLARIEAAAALLRLSSPSADLDGVSPNAIIAAAQDLYRVTFFLSEIPAPISVNP